MPKIAILHTSPATIEPLRALAAELLPGVEVVNLVDDSILPELRRNGGDVAAVAGRLAQYAAIAAGAGAEVILNACSSVGEAVAAERAMVTVPVVRIDDALAETAVARASRLGVVATLPTTLVPTTRLLEAKAAEAGKSITVKPVLVAGAFERLTAGDPAGHDALLLAAIEALAAEVEVVVLAQATMARVVPSLPTHLRDRVLSSPRLGMQAVRQAMGVRDGND